VRELGGSYARSVAVLLVAIVAMSLFGWLVMGMPGTDVRDLIVFLAASGGGSILIGYALVSAAPRLGLGGIRPRLMLAHLALLVIAFANIVVTAWLMFISPHDLGLLGLLLAFSAIVAFAFAAMTAEQMLLGPAIARPNAAEQSGHAGRSAVTPDRSRGLHWATSSPGAILSALVAMEQEPDRPCRPLTT
jgi:hypothetical protein